MASDFIDHLPRIQSLGRRRKFHNSEHFDRLVDSYFTACIDGDKPPTLAGLALWMGYSSKTAMLASIETHPQLSQDSIDRALSLLEFYHEHNIATGYNVSGAKFLLEANHGYRTETEKQGQSLTINIDSKDAKL